MSSVEHVESQTTKNGDDTDGVEVSTAEPFGARFFRPLVSYFDLKKS